jgi:predicted enzyme related to lactoylglutathione lyase
MGNPGNDRRIDNIEFAVSDIARSREFYGKAFGWTFTDYALAVFVLIVLLLAAALEQ